MLARSRRRTGSGGSGNFGARGFHLIENGVGGVEDAQLHLRGAVADLCFVIV